MIDLFHLIIMIYVTIDGFSYDRYNEDFFLSYIDVINGWDCNMSYNNDDKISGALRLTHLFNTYVVQWEIIGLILRLQCN